MVIIGKKKSWRGRGIGRGYHGSGICAHACFYAVFSCELKTIMKKLASKSFIYHYKMKIKVNHVDISWSREGGGFYMDIENCMIYLYIQERPYQDEYFLGEPEYHQEHTKYHESIPAL